LRAVWAGPEKGSKKYDEESSPEHKNLSNQFTRIAGVISGLLGIELKRLKSVTHHSPDDMNGIVNSFTSSNEPIKTT
jgi:hypothetical protein